MEIKILNKEAQVLKVNIPVYKKEEMVPRKIVLILKSKNIKLKNIN